MLIAIAQLNYHIGNLRYNIDKIVRAIQEGKEHGADLVIFAEMALTGYPAKDLWLSPDFLHDCRQGLDEIAEHCQGIACIVGAPVKNPAAGGKPLYNAAVLLEGGRIRSVAHKGLLPDYDVFDELRYFQPGEQFTCVDFKGVRIALTICEDLWNVQMPIADAFDLQGPLYPDDPMARLAEQKPDIIINIAASPFATQHFETRMEVLRTHVHRYRIPLIYVNQVGGNADLIFDGRSVVIDPNGQLEKELAAFDEDTVHIRLLPGGEIAPISERGGAVSDPLDAAAPDDITLVHQALLLGIRDYFRKSGFSKALLGLSGGLDSAVVAALACEALGPDQVVTVLMPSEFSSEHSLQDALDLVANTGCHHHIVPIHEPAAAFSAGLSALFAGLPLDATEENIQARTRAVILMALANKFGYTLLNTSNKSEAAVGYGTLYGDMAGAFSVIGDVYKTDVYRLANYLNRDREVIPVHTIVKPPSAELRPDQKDSDSLPPYTLLDTILRGYIEENQTLAEISDRVGDAALVDRITEMVDRAEFKRHQAPPVLRVSKKAFGPGRSMPLVAKKSNL